MRIILFFYIKYFRRSDKQFITEFEYHSQKKKIELYRTKLQTVHSIIAKTKTKKQNRIFKMYIRISILKLKISVTFKAVLICKVADF